jgi:hypothetical protein
VVICAHVGLVVLCLHGNFRLDLPFCYACVLTSVQRTL